MLASVGSIVVGLVFLWAGGIKAVSPDAFYTHLNRLGIKHNGIRVAAVVAAAGGEVGLGAALILGLQFQLLTIATAVLLAVLSVVTWASIKSGRVTDCGCYGGVIVPSLPQTVLINGAMIVLLLSGLVWHFHMPVDEGVAFGIVAVTGVAAASLAGYAVWYAITKAKLLFNLSPLKVGNRWKGQWSPGFASRQTDELIVTFMGPDCPFCKMWIPVLNAIDAAPELPNVVGIIAGSPERLEAFRTAQQLKFSTGIISQGLSNRLVTVVPTTVVIKKGIISDIWTGQMSQDFAQRFKGAFFPSAMRS